jgi:hypothetical protein
MVRVVGDSWLELYQEVVDEGLREEGGVPSRNRVIESPDGAGGEEYA